MFVANGCLGGATYSGKQAEKYCGERLRRTPAHGIGHLGQPVAQCFGGAGRLASRARVVRERASGAPLTTALAVDVGGHQHRQCADGEVAPRPASTQHTAFDLGSARKFQVSVEAEGRSLFSQSWSSVLAQGGLAELENGRGYALVLNGPQADLEAVPGLWNAPMVTAIAVDPE